MKIIKNIAILTLLLISTFSVEAQRSGKLSKNLPNKIKKKDINRSENFKSYERIFWGVLLDATTKKPLEYATISVINKKTNGIIKGTITDEKGKFSIVIDKERVNYYLLIDFLGYTPQLIKNLDLSKDKINLGKVLIQAETSKLNEVVITAEISKTTFKLDKRIFNVGKDLTNSGASTLQILENVPSVTVGIKGEVFLRGNSNVKILVNGNESASSSKGKSALRGITADMIQRIEVITNPSVKYDADGTAGILNIILKKERKSGLNGSVSVNAGTPENYGLGINLNYRTNKLSLSGGINGGFDRSRSFYKSVTIDKRITPQFSRFSDEKSNNIGKELYTNFGVDYNITPTDFLSASVSVGISKGDNASIYNYNTVSGNTTTKFKRTGMDDNESPNYDLNLNYKKTLGGKDNHTLEARYSGFNYTEKSKASFVNIGTSTTKERSNNIYSEGNNALQVDYKYPFGKPETGGTIEIGGKYRNQKLKNNYKVDNLIANNWVQNTNLANVFRFNENLLAGYATYGQQFGKMSLKAGLRFENTKLTTKLENTNKTNTQNYTDLFPSLHTSYKFTDNLSMQLSYSQRISRPDMFNLNPFISIADSFTQFRGNPNLKPEYSNLYEFGVLRSLTKGSLFASVYTRTTKNTVEQSQSLINGITIVTPLNIGKRDDLGVEFNGSYKVVKWLRLTSNFNWFYYKYTTNYASQIFNINSSQWFTNLGGLFKLPKDLVAELNINYSSKQKQLLQTQGDNFYINLGLKKKLFKNRVSVNLSCRDLFNSRKSTSLLNLPNFYRSQTANWGGRQFNLGVSIKLGKTGAEDGAMDYESDY